jgi:membrane-bound lytic murein transglycosylase MltF
MTRKHQQLPVTLAAPEAPASTFKERYASGKALRGKVPRSGHAGWEPPRRDQYSFPYLLLAAQAYQESGLNQTLKSRVGAVGVMQIKPSTAANKPIGIPEVQKLDRNIEAGAKYMRYMVQQYYADEPMEEVTKGLFAIASYNAGPARIQKLRKEAAQRGYNPNLWFNNVELIASAEIGRETVQYVSNIYKYYLAYKMVTERHTKSDEIMQKSGAAKP